MLRRLLFRQPVEGMFPNLGLFIFRLTVGLSMAFAHGIGKVPPSAGLAKGVAAMGFPLPEVFAWGAGLSEFLGGICIALGLLTRFNAAHLCITMGVAAFVRHSADPFATKEKAILFLASFALLLFVGAGRYSIDAILGKR